MSKSAFSLIEVLVFTSILSIFFVAAATVTTVSLRNLKISERKIIATRYMEDVASWLRAQKESDWNTFAEK
ncbi:MAG: type II secretion system protein, partial [bacterium]|nr:type II secretion system protein [bacterium]